MIRYWANIQQAKLGFDYQDAAALVPLPFILLDNFRAQKPVNRHATVVALDDFRLAETWFLSYFNTDNAGYCGRYNECPLQDTEESNSRSVFHKGTHEKREVCSSVKCRRQHVILRLESERFRNLDQVEKSGAERGRSLTDAAQ